MNKEEALKKIEELKSFVEQCEEGEENTNPFFTYIYESTPTNPKIYDKNSYTEYSILKYGNKVAEDSSFEVWERESGALFLRLKSRGKQDE